MRLRHLNKLAAALIAGTLFYNVNAQALTSRAQYDTAFALVDLEENKTLISKNETQKMLIASVTKMMSALVILHSSANLDESVRVVSKRPNRWVSSRYIQSGMYLTRRELLYLTLISSDNLAAYTLAATYPNGGFDAFVDEMNARANILGMTDSEFEDPAGVMLGNKSTIADIIKMSIEASKYAEFTYAANAVNRVIYVPDRKGKMRPIVFGNTNNFVTTLDIVAAKTGYTSHAGRCLTMVFTRNGKTYAVVVLGAPTPNERTAIIRNLINIT